MNIILPLFPLKSLKVVFIINIIETGCENQMSLNKNLLISSRNHCLYTGVINSIAEI